MARLVNVTMNELTDEEIDEMASQREVDDPEQAAELRRLQAWRRDHPADPMIDERGRGYLVLRAGWGRPIVS